MFDKKDMFGKQEKNVLFFDMEMIPAEDEKRSILEKWFHEKGKEDEEIGSAIELTSLDGAWGRILCIAYAFGEGPVEILYDANVRERNVLEAFWKIAQKARLIVGHKILESDLVFLHQRSLVHGIRPSIDLDLRDGGSELFFDTAWEWGLGKKYASLEKLCLVFNLPNPKEIMHGSQVPKYHRQGKDETILTYCKADVEAVRGVYKRLTYQEK